MNTLYLTGGLASGKSTVVKHLAAKGAHVIDADRLGHKVYDPGTPAYEQVIATFGEEVRGEDGQINRKALGAKVFGKPAELKKLTDIVWPEIGRMTEAEIAATQASQPETTIVVEAAVLFEAGWNQEGREVWVLVVEPELAIQRAMARDGLTREAVEQRLASQLSNAARRAKADVVLENNGSLAELLAAVDAAWEARQKAG